MLYELHATTSPEVDLEDWCNFCAGLNVKPLDIRLHGGGQNSRQIMTAGTFEGNDDDADLWIGETTTSMIANGFPIDRIKLEVPLDKSAPYKGSVVYHECHVKCLLDPMQVIANQAAAEAEGWIASWNMLKVTDDGFQKWYFTKRVPGNWDYRDAGCAFGIDFSNTTFIGAVRMEKETVIYDSNPEYDAGWA